MGDCIVCGENCMADVREAFPGCRYQDYNNSVWKASSGDVRDDDPALGSGPTEAFAYHEAANRLFKVQELRKLRAGCHNGKV